MVHEQSPHTPIQYDAETTSAPRKERNIGSFPTLSERHQKSKNPSIDTQQADVVAQLGVTESVRPLPAERQKHLESFPPTKGESHDVFIDRRTFFHNLIREHEDDLTLEEKNARHPLLTKNQVKQIYTAMKEGAEVSSLLSSNFLQETKKGKEREYLTEILLIQETPRDVLIATNQRLIYKVAQALLGRGVDKGELYSEGNIGLMTAIERFKPELGFEFSTYATWWIRQALMRAIENQGRTIRVPVHIYESLSNAKTLFRTFANEQKRTPSLDEMKQLLQDAGFSPGKIDFVTDELYAKKLIPQSLDEHLPGQLGEAGIARGELHADPSATTEESAIESYASTELQQNLIEAIKRTGLSEKEKLILKLRFGLDDKKPNTLQEVGDSLGLTRERVRQIEAKALATLRNDEQLRAQADYLDTTIPQKNKRRRNL